MWHSMIMILLTLLTWLILNPQSCVLSDCNNPQGQGAGRCPPQPQASALPLLSVLSWCVLIKQCCVIRKTRATCQVRAPSCSLEGT